MSDENKFMRTHKARERNSRGAPLDDLALTVERGEFGIEVSLHRDASMFADDGSACWDDLTPDQATSMLFAMRDMIDDALDWLGE